MALPKTSTCPSPAFVLTRTLLPGQGRSWEPSTVAVPAALPAGFVRAAVVGTAPGGDELRVRAWLVRFGVAR